MDGLLAKAAQGALIQFGKLQLRQWHRIPMQPLLAEQETIKR